MLFFGYLAEKGFTDFITGAILGFVPFIVMFKMIYEHYAKESTIGRITFAYFVGVWALYGFASLFPYTYKNIFYNILDLFSKNVFGIFLAIVLLLSPKQ
jgi:bacteriorhodopsin